ncbi:MAG: GNAT family N-acetyltransferase [Proteobacteria bacterium]|nr:GNAT family N-acetyltransferase [Pseudomonadota bacterium]
MSEIECDDRLRTSRRQDLFLLFKDFTIEKTTGALARTAASDKGTGLQGGSVNVVSRADLGTCEKWESVLAAECKDRRYYEIVEDTLHSEIVHRYIRVIDRMGTARAVQPYFILDRNLIEGVGATIKSAVGVVRRLWPRFMYMRTLVLGCMAGEGRLDGDLFSQDFAAPQLAHVLVEQARAHHAGLIVLKEFSAQYRRALDCLRQQGFIRLPSLPMTDLNIEYSSFSDYMETALSRATRKNLRRKFKAAERAAPIELTVVNDLSANVEDVYPLYLQVYDRSNFHFEKLTPAFLCELGRRMPDKTRFFIWRQEGRVIAFSICMVHGDTIHDEYIGLDYSVALDLHLYHYTFRDIVTWAMANGYKRYRSNGLNYDPKLHLRCQLNPLDLYARHTSPAINAVMQLVLPWLEPTHYDKNLARFPNYHELRGDP